ncbi:TPA: cob(I)yrinic acid a,c-diamide adenosyltransferase [Yersinia enterocolitica]|uniref:Putative propanediol utilization protein: B12 related n=1 Tax=Yersinia enterocolitica TaxID=630 RepID=A0A0H5GUN8_YEREN|nr:cob(I)yrinic acid a,c-diamide adenosyltransferase [Yersinia enterocolitica]EKN3325113.1 cob(I)yrinic acid a,c-diamide adenosyltransferase [Yersinia enterocolitica]EKN3329585.1 cob(I)yrinic acid a,c-diamide adenosyltransferase [Yersinia enterocolitica]EKN3349417.1 cob(I)yrinic acid a,c-diamide adenosyltransferase [Yersinia enterocolitica]EKN3357533.1 cob(I)yrinic acid a,c-diamide adenosyltransferase [Yersinia enterocolitica]EKN3363959.1 cob(I)yrinic acid a,c-diamide adenosyltransferase [Yers
MSIYTKTGDAGTTALFTGQRVKKSHPRVETYGTLDELNAALSLCARVAQGEENLQLLDTIQHQLFYFSAELASEGIETPPSGRKSISEPDIQALEQAVDRCMAQLPPVHGFILPGNTEAGSRLHFARTLARRSERQLIELAEQVPVRPVLLQYLNRLSDCLYALARDEDQRQQLQQTTQTVVARYLAAITEKPVATTQPASTGLGFSDVHQLVKLAVEAAMTLQIAVVVALTDRHGNMIMTYRMPDTLLVSSELAPKKAWTAVAMKTATHQLSAAIQPGADLFQLEASTGGKVVSFGGGYPLWRDGQLVGGLGISGGSVEQDMHIAEAAISALHLRNE